MPVASKKRTRSILGRLLRFDQNIRQSHACELIIGVDEVGLGCLAGPVIAAAAVLPVLKQRSKQTMQWTELNDSKKLDSEQRNVLSKVISAHAQVSIASASVEEINEINILQASLLAKKRAVLDLLAKCSLPSEVTMILVDGNKKLPALEFKQIAVIQGDGLSASIAAASVIAKVFRDQFMQELSAKHPHYNWHQNKGYGSVTHRRAIVEHGLCDWHRKDFVKNLLLQKA